MSKVLKNPPAPLKLDDKQSERDTRELRIDKVGVRGLRFPIQVRDKARSVQNTCLLYTSSATDACSGIVHFTQLPPAGSALPLGTNFVTFFVDDGNGNTNYCTAPVTVQERCV